jgi:hypothetical protein
MDSRYSVFDIAKLALDPSLVSVPPTNLKGISRRRPKGEAFLSFPIPIAWAARANSLGHHVWLVGFLCWYLYGMNKGPSAFSNVLAKRWGIDRYQKARCLKKLAKAGLIELECRGNKSPVVLPLELTTR